MTSRAVARRALGVEEEARGRVHARIGSLRSTSTDACPSDQSSGQRRQHSISVQQDARRIFRELIDVEGWTQAQTSLIGQCGQN